MIPLCLHWQDVKKPNAGRCALGLHGGEPSHGVCSVCELRDGDGPDLLERVRNLTEATKQETKAFVSGVPPVPTEEIERRRAICFAPCEKLNEKEECIMCGCKMRAKTAWRSQHCPIGKW